MDYNGGDSIAQLTPSLTISLCLASQSNLTAICSQPTANTRRKSKHPTIPFIDQGKEVVDSYQNT